MFFILVFNNACYGGTGHTRAVYTTGTWESPVILPIQDKSSYRVSCSTGIHPDNQSQYQQHVSVWSTMMILSFDPHNQHNARLLISHGDVKARWGTCVNHIFNMLSYPGTYQLQQPKSNSAVYPPSVYFVSLAIYKFNRSIMGSLYHVVPL
jgi:hypothetical protein